MKKVFLCIITLLLFFPLSNAQEVILKRDLYGNQHAYITNGYPIKTSYNFSFNIICEVPKDLSQSQYFLQILWPYRDRIKLGEASIQIGDFSVNNQQEFNLETLLWHYKRSGISSDTSTDDFSKYIYIQNLIFPVSIEELEDILSSMPNKMNVNILKHSFTVVLDRKTIKRLNRDLKIIKHKTENIQKSYYSDVRSFLNATTHNYYNSSQWGLQLLPNGRFYSASNEGIRIILKPSSEQRIRIIQIIDKFYSDIETKKANPYYIYLGEPAFTGKETFKSGYNTAVNQNGSIQLYLKVQEIGENTFIINPIISHIWYDGNHGTAGHYGEVDPDSTIGHDWYYSLCDFCREMFFDDNGNIINTKRYKSFISIIETQIRDFLDKKFCPALHTTYKIERAN